MSFPTGLRPPATPVGYANFAIVTELPGPLGHDTVVCLPLTSSEGTRVLSRVAYLTLCLGLFRRPRCWLEATPQGLGDPDAAHQLTMVRRQVAGPTLKPTALRI